MKTQLVGILFCALVCSSLAHDWLRGQASIQEAKTNQLNRLDYNLLDSLKNIQGKFVEENDIGQLTKDIETRTGGNNVQYYCSSSNPNILVIANVAANLAIVCDILNGIFLLCNGNDGTGILYIISSGLCYYVTESWNVSLITLKIWVATISLVVIANLISNVVVVVNSPSLAVLTLCQTVIGSLDGNVFIQVNTNINISLTLSISLCIQIILSLNSNLLGLINLVVVDYIVINGGLYGFIGILEGLIDLFVTANLLVQTVVLAGVILHMTVILQKPDGVSCFAYVAGQIGIQFDLVAYLGIVITDITIFLRICVKLGGNVYTGVNGVFRVVAAVYALTSALMTVDAVLLIILNVCANVNGILTITAATSSIQALIAAQIVAWNNGNGLTNLNNFITALILGNCFKSNIHISLIISTLCGGIITTVLDLCIDIVVCITAYVTATITISLYYATLLRVILFCLNDIPGRILINIIIPGLNISIIYSNVCLNLLSGLLITLAFVLLTLNTLGLVIAFSLVPILTNIYTPCYNAIFAKTGLQLDALLIDFFAVQEYNLISSWMNTIEHCGC